MTLTQWLLFFLVVQVIHFLGTWKLYVRAGRQAWEAAVPVYNAVVLMKIINRSKWWVLLLFIPIVQLIMLLVVWVETIRSFGFRTYKDTALVIFTLGFYIYYVNYLTDAPYIHDRDIMPKSTNGEWVSSILFAVVAATLVHTYFMQPFTIPTSSLEKTLLVGDYLFVSKFHYGARAPKTTIAMPMLHDTIPSIPVPKTDIKLTPKFKSYSSWPELPYFRLPGFQKIKRNDIVVFSWPVDTLVDITPGSRNKTSAYKPIDKKSNYVKRCVGLPGDSLEVRGGYVYINGTKNALPDRAKLQFSYELESNELLTVVSGGQYTNIPTEFYADRYNISDISYPLQGATKGQYRYNIQLTDAAYEKLKNNSNIPVLKRTKFPEGLGSESLFPFYSRNNQNIDEFGPIYIPEAGKTVAITPESLPFYKRIIEAYEGSEMGIEQKITTQGNQVLLNGSPLNEYTFKQDYYWMMGDNRHNSQDARAWGYVPWNHVVGKPVFVWFSLDGKKSGFFNRIRWDRVFTTVSGSGETKSYFVHFLILLALYFVGNTIWKKRKTNKA